MLVSERTFPHNLEAERALLGSILIDNAALGVALESIGRDDLFSESHRIAFDKMVAISEKGRTINLVTLSEELGKEELLEKVGGASYLAALTDGVPVGSSATVAEYAEIVLDKSLLRQIINTSNNVIARALEATDESSALLDMAESQFCDIRERKVSVDAGPVSVGDAMGGAVQVLNRLCENDGHITGTPTGIGSLDQLTAGWHPGEMVILAARPSMGKTTLAIEFALRLGKPVNIFSLETSKESLVIRMLCRIGKVDMHRLRRGLLGRDDWKKLSEAAYKLHQMPIWIDDRSGVSIHALRARIRSLARRTGAKLTIVDYMQLARAKAENRTQEVTLISQELKTAGLEMGRISGGTLIAIAQLNRAVEYRADRRPQLSDLRESGQIEQDADVVMFISTDLSTVKGPSDPHVKNIDIAKQKNGPLDTVRLVFLPQITGFEEATGG